MVMRMIRVDEAARRTGLPEDAIHRGADRGEIRSGTMQTVRGPCRVVDELDIARLCLARGLPPFPGSTPPR